MAKDHALVRKLDRGGSNARRGEGGLRSRLTSLLRLPPIMEAPDKISDAHKKARNGQASCGLAPSPTSGCDPSVKDALATLHAALQNSTEGFNSRLKPMVSWERLQTLCELGVADSRLAQALIQTTSSRRPTGETEQAYRTFDAQPHCRHGHARSCPRHPLPWISPPATRIGPHDSIVPDGLHGTKETPASLRDFPGCWYARP